MEFFQGPSCPVCGEPYASPEADRHLCSSCENKLPSFDRAVSAGRYDGVLAEAIHLFKYAKKIGLGRPLGDLLADHLPEDIQADVIVPVPLHPQRLRGREFNQSLVLAEVVARRRKIPNVAGALIRTVHRPPQIGLKRPERLANVRGVFAPGPIDLSGVRALLIDDVYTTGATVGECARVLKRAGAAYVTVATLARIPRA